MAIRGALELVPVLKAGVLLEDILPAVPEEGRLLLRAVDGRSALIDLAARINLPRERVREIASDLVAREFLELLEPVAEAQAFEEGVFPFPGMRFTEDLDRLPWKGRLPRDSVLKLFLKARMEGSTGVLRIIRPPEAEAAESYYKAVYLADGEVVDCRTHPFQPAECLGRMLQRAGYVDQKAVVESLRRVKERGVFQGQALREMGALSEESLRKALAAQLEIKLAEVLDWPFCFYDFTPRTTFPGRVAQIPASLASVLYNAVWKRYPLEDVVGRLERVYEKYVGKTESPPFAVEEFQFGRIYAKFWEEILEHDAPVKRVMIVSNMKKEQTARALFALYSLGMIEFLDASREDPTQRLVMKLNEAIKSLERNNHFHALRVHWSADSAAIAAAYRKRMAELEEEMRGTSGVVRMLYERIAERVRAAYEAVRDPDQRRAYRQKIFDPFFLEFNSDIFRQKGESFLFTKDEFQLAVNELESATEVYPQEGEYFSLLGLALFYLHYPKDAEKIRLAREYISRGLRLRPRSDVAHLCQGLMHKHEGAASLARKSLAEAVRLNPANRFAQIELRSLDEVIPEADRHEAIEAYLKRHQRTKVGQA